MNDEILNEFVVTLERKNIEDGSIDDRVDDRVDDRDTDREDRDNNVKVTHVPYNTLNGEG